MSMSAGTGITTAQADSRLSARDRILEAAYRLFSRFGIQAVGVDAIAKEAGVAKMTMYRHFGSKEELVLAFLRQREDRWTNGWLRAEVESRTDDPAERLLTIFDVFGEWFRSDDFDGCAFVNVVLEFDDRENSARKASVQHLANIRDFLRETAEGAGVSDLDNFSRQWHILMKGSIVAAGEGDADAASRAKEVGRLLLKQEIGSTPAGV